MRTFKEKETGRTFTEEEYRKFWEEEANQPDGHFFGVGFEEYVYEQCHSKNCPDEEIVDRSIILGVMLRHTDGDLQYWNVPLSYDDQERIFEILIGYDEENTGEDIRGNLTVVNDDDGERFKPTTY